MAASGATRMGGGADVRVLGTTRLECKVTEKSSYTIKLAELMKVFKQAIRALEQPVLQFAFRHTTGRMKKYAVISWPANDQADNHSQWDKKTSSYTVTESELESALFTGRIKLVLYAKDGTCRHFEVLGWGQFVDRLMFQQVP